MDAIVSSNGNYNIKDTYKTKYQHAKYVDTRMNGLALLKGREKNTGSGQNTKSQPVLKQCSSAFLETYLLAEREKRLNKYARNVENSFNNNSSVRNNQTQK